MHAHGIWASDITMIDGLLQEEETAAFNPAFASIYRELRQRARRLKSRMFSQASTTTVLHEAYLKLAVANLSARDGEHFMAIAAQAMRQAVLNIARNARAEKRGGDLAHFTLDEALAAEPGNGPCEVIALDQALSQLAQESPRQAQLVELHFFSGLSFADSAKVLGVTERTVQRDWREARARLAVMLSYPP